MNKLKLLVALLMSTLVIFASQKVYIAKSDEIVGIYSDIFFTRLAVETQQYTRQIEYGLQNGRTLDSFYDIQSILANIKRCSSYINGAYIVSDSRTVLYSLEENVGAGLWSMRVPSADSIYAVCSIGDNYIMSQPICGKSGECEGYLVLNLNRSAVSNSVADFNRESISQTIVVSALALMAGYILIIHKCRRRETIYRDCLIVTSVTVCSAVFIDSAISVIKLQTMLDSLIQQSVSKIVMALHNDLDSLVDKGISVNRIYDLNSWLMESCRQIPFIDNLIYDKNYKISAVLVSDYSANQVAAFALALVEILGICAAAGAALCLLGWLGDKLSNRRKNKESGERKNVNKDKTTIVSA
ncbi:MAG: hypothetical protein ACI4WS_13480 [Oscillospiraceae bacterium]